jgi:glycosyltransferase involved in cell wall biosynthesis
MAQAGEMPEPAATAALESTFVEMQRAKEELAAQDRAALEQLRGLAQVVLVAVGGLARFLNLLRAPFSRLPLQTLAYYSQGYDRVLRGLVRQGRFDLAHVQMVRMGPALSTLSGTPCILDMVDTASLNMQRQAARESPLVRWLPRLEAARLREYESALMEKSAWVLVTSPADLAALGPCPRASVLPIGVDLEILPFVEEGRERNLIVFTGRMGYFPNADAALYFAVEVLPRIRQAMPEAVFRIVGVDPPRRVRALRSLPGVEVVEESDLRPSLHRAAVAVAPLRSGTGIQIKVLEAMASGAPVVATPIVAPAIHARNGEEWLVAESTADLADAVLRVLRDRAFSRQMARAGRKHVEAHFTWQRLGEELEATWARVAAGRFHG